MKVLASTITSTITTKTYNRCRISLIIFVPSDRVIFLSCLVRVRQCAIFGLISRLSISTKFTFLRRRCIPSSILRRRRIPNSILRRRIPNSILSRRIPSSIRRRIPSSILSGQSCLFSSLLSSVSSPEFFSNYTLVWNNSLISSRVIILLRLNLRTTINVG